MRYCRKCGTPLQPGVTSCPQCGTFMLPDPPSAPTNAEIRPIPPNKPQAQMVEAPPPPMASSYPVAGYYGTYSPQPKQASPYYSPSPSFKPPLTKPTRSSLGRSSTVFLVILALLMMFSGIALIYYTAATRPAQFRAQATATVQSIVNAQMQATTTAKAQAQATAQVQAHLTATAQAQAQTLRNIYNTATSGTPAFSSTLTAQDDANWSNYNAIGGGGCSFSNNALHASTFQNHTYVPCFAQNSHFTNFAFQIQMTIIQGDGGGLIFRANEANVQLYLLRISYDGLFGISVSRDSKTSTPILDDNNGAIKTGGQTNLVTIIARNSALSVYVNKQFVGMINDTTYTAGEIGVFAYDGGKDTDVAFSNATVWTL